MKNNDRKNDLRKKDSAGKNKREKAFRACFRYRFAGTTLALAIGALAVCVVAAAVSVWRISANGIHGVYDALTSPLLLAISMLGAILVIAMLVRSQYILDVDDFTTKFGFIKSKIPVGKITAAVFDTETRKLALYMGEEYIVVSLQPEWNEEFMRALSKVNPDVDCSYALTDGKPKDKRGKSGKSNDDPDKTDVADKKDKSDKNDD